MKDIIIFFIVLFMQKASAIAINSREIISGIRNDVLEQFRSTQFANESELQLREVIRHNQYNISII